MSFQEYNSPLIYWKIHDYDIYTIELGLIDAKYYYIPVINVQR